MKSLTSSILSLAIVLFSLVSCKNSDSRCIRGTIKFKSCCTGTTLIELPPGSLLGEKIEFNGKQYQRAIQVVGLLEGDTFEGRLRPYDPEKDKDLIKNVCMCLTPEAFTNLPIYVVKQSCTDE